MDTRIHFDAGSKRMELVCQNRDYGMYIVTDAGTGISEYWLNENGLFAEMRSSTTRIPIGEFEYKRFGDHFSWVFESEVTQDRYFRTNENTMPAAVIKTVQWLIEHAMKKKLDDRWSIRPLVNYYDDFPLPTLGGSGKSTIADWMKVNFKGLRNG